MLGMRCACAFALLLIPKLLTGCHCPVSWSVCQDAVTSNLVFIGTVEKIQPSLLDRSKPSANPNWMQTPEVFALQQDKSASGLRRLKDYYLKLLSDLPEISEARIQSAKTQEELRGVMTWIFSQGTEIRFKVRTLFRQDDDDADSNSPKPTKAESVEIWNEPGDCGISFQKGETYLVYATDDEKSGHMETGVCHRTARLSDAGDDLAYLYFVQNGGSESIRLEGFVTSDIDQLNPNRFHYSGKIQSPVSDVVVELKSDRTARYSEPDGNGRFVFDGLSPGDYQVSALDATFPARTKVLSGPQRVDVKAGACPVTTLLVIIRSLRR